MTNYVYGYARVSTDDQARNGTSIETQISILKHSMAAIAVKHNLEIGAIFPESDGVSAFKTDFLARPQGRNINSIIQPGDHIAVSRHDRAFRNIRDMSVTVDYFSKMGIIIHMVNLGIDTGSSHGKLMLSMLVAAAQWESETKSERIREYYRFCRENGFVGSHAQRGMKLILARNGRRLQIVDKTQMAVVRYCGMLHAKGNLSFRQIADRLEAILAKKEGRKYIHEFNEKTPRLFNAEVVSEMVTDWRRFYSKGITKDEYALKMGNAASYRELRVSCKLEKLTHKMHARKRKLRKVIPKGISAK